MQLGIWQAGSALALSLALQGSTATNPVQVTVTTSEQTSRVFTGVPAAVATFAPQPVYPAIARGAHVEGMVGILVTVRKDGTVKDAKVSRHVGPLDEAALAAVRQWRFTPMIFNGKPVEFIYTQEMTFKESAESITFSQRPASIPLGVDADAVPPRIVKRVDPTAPSNPNQSAVTGRVIVELVVDTAGKVKSAISLQSTAAALAQPAIDALQKWEFVPAMVNGTPAESVFTAIVVFGRSTK